jgi:hypothetical protein
VAAEVKYLTDPKAGVSEAELEQSSVPRFSPTHLLVCMGQEIPGLSGKDVQRYYVPTDRAVLRAVCEEVTATRTKRDEVIAGISNGGVSAQELTVRLEATQRVIKVVKHFAA